VPQPPLPLHSFFPTQQAFSPFADAEGSAGVEVAAVDAGLAEVAPAGFEVEVAEAFASAEAFAVDAVSPHASARSDATAARTTGLFEAEV
jgi:hypothetical protein